MSQWLFRGDTGVELDKLKNSVRLPQMQRARITMANIVSSTSDGASTQSSMACLREKLERPLLKTSVPCTWE